jgi:hypothetical protein
MISLKLIKLYISIAFGLYNHWFKFFSLKNVIAKLRLYF